MLGTVLSFAYIFWNVFCFFLMFSDKQKAIEGSYRVPEKRLFTYAFFFGAFGIAFGMMAFSHKTKKTDFIFKIGLSILVNIVCIFLLLMLC